ncbi:helix-turn-helix transcriptional regulator [Sinorhizobium sp. BJ1]|uniref:helix-turn-helix transcriptional regulator n=1 Tax=Sinorhizobium sp. BJ1 TaxID=2035455 RepID=UPI000BE87A5C|nr:helix-turn-helix transcriptional regulator [Sinorhizobium sp. BJ1]PDT81357.1 hypothetical protein CO676_22820 [Sinorhizobium sp. BJ1]
MAKNKLKKCRVEAGLTQSKLAAAVGVTQPTYHRWEVGQLAIPKGKLNKLADELKTTPEAILGTHPPIKAAFYDPDAPEQEQYYGEVAIHFSGGGEPILLSISEDAHGTLYADLQGDNQFLIVKSLSNQTVAIRSDAISDVYFSSEAYDYFGPKGETYRQDSPLHLPDSRDWEIIEAIATDTVDMEDFDGNHLQRIQEILSPTSDEEFRRLVNDGVVKAEEVQGEKAKERAKLERIFRLAKDVTYQLSMGQRRNVQAESDAIYEAFWGLIEWPDAYENEIIRIPAEGYHRTIFINPKAVDYISIPTHKWEDGSIQAHAELIDDGDDQPSAKTKRR